MKARILTGFLCVLLVCLSLTGCKPGDVPNDPANSSGSVNSSTNEEDVLNRSTQPVTLLLVENGTAKCRIVKQDGLSGDTVSAVLQLQKAIKTATGANIDVETDILCEEESGILEILIGATNRQASQDATDSLREEEWVVETWGNALIISGGSDEAVLNAVNWFFVNCVQTLSGNTLEFCTGQNHAVQATYAIESFLCNGMELRRYTIVVPSSYAYNEKWFACMFNAYLSDAYGFVLPVQVGDIRHNAEYELLIGSTTRTTSVAGSYEFVIRADGKQVEMLAGSLWAYSDMLDHIKQTLAAGTAVHINLQSGYLFRQDVSANFTNGNEYLVSREGDVRIFYNNIGGQWTASEDANTAVRMKMLSEQYLFYQPDVIGLQECSMKCRNGSSSDIIKMLKEGGYTEAGNGGCTPVLYRESTLTLVANGYATYQDGMNDPSKSYTYGVFRVKSSGKTFAFISTHFWWNGEEARVKDAKQLLPVIRSVQSTYQCPVIIGGDFNGVLTTESLTYLRTNGCSDVRKLADKVDWSFTWHSPANYNSDYGVYTTYSAPSADLDHILLYGDGVRFRYYDVAQDLYSYLSTDHLSVIAEFDFQ